MEEVILLPIGSFYPAQLGGPSNTMFWHAKGLVKSGVKVVVVTRDHGINGRLNSDEFIDMQGIRIVYCSSFLTFFTRVVQEMKKASIVHLNSLFYLPSVISFFTARVARKRVVWSVRGELEAPALKSKYFGKMLIVKFLQIFARDITFHGTSVAEITSIENYFNCSQVVNLPNYIEYNYEKSVRDFLVTRRQKVLFLGRLHPIKNILFILEVFRSSDRLNDVELILAGKREGDYYRILLEYVTLNKMSNVHFLGHVEGALKSKILGESKCLILPSFTENFGNVVLEALGHGTPVLTSIHTPWDIIEEKGCGAHLPLEKSQWRDAMEKVLFDVSESEFQLMAKSGMELVRDNFSIEVGISRWVDFYKSKKIC